MEFRKKKFMNKWFIWFHEFFWPELFYFSGPLCLGRHTNFTNHKKVEGFFSYFLIESTRQQGSNQRNFKIFLALLKKKFVKLIQKKNQDSKPEPPNVDVCFTSEHTYLEDFLCIYFLLRLFWRLIMWTNAKIRNSSFQFTSRKFWRHLLTTCSQFKRGLIIWNLDTRQGLRNCW